MSKRNRNLRAKKKYDRIAPSLGSTTYFYKAVVRFAVGLTKPYHKVLDVGCGEGNLLKLFVDKNFGCKFYGLDFSKARVLKAKTKTRKAYWMIGDALNLPIKNDFFDIVISSELIEHVTDPLKLLNEIHRIVKKNGILIMTLPNALAYYPFYFLLKRLPEVIKMRFRGYTPYEDPMNTRQPIDHAYTSTYLLKIIKKCSFKIIKHSRGMPTGYHDFSRYSEEFFKHPIFAYHYFVAARAC